jgi:hypothetical protein
VAVPKIVEADAREVLHPAHHVREFVGRTSRLLWLTVLSAAHQSLAGLPNSDPQQLLSLFELEAAKLFDCEGRKGDDRKKPPASLSVTSSAPASPRNRMRWTSFKAQVGCALCPFEADRRGDAAIPCGMTGSKVAPPE